MKVLIFLSRPSNLTLKLAGRCFLLVLNFLRGSLLLSRCVFSGFRDCLELGGMSGVGLVSDMVLISDCVRVCLNSYSTKFICFLYLLIVVHSIN